MTSKERADLKTQAMKIDSIFQIGKSSLSPAQVEAMKSALQARELIKISVLKNCTDNPAQLAEVIAERTGSQVVQVIGKKIVLYKKNHRKEAERKRAGKQQKRGMQEGKGETARSRRSEGAGGNRKGRTFGKGHERAAGKGTAKAVGKGTARAAGKGIARTAGKGNGRLQGGERGRRNRAERHG